MPPATNCKVSVNLRFIVGDWTCVVLFVGLGHMLSQYCIGHLYTITWLEWHSGRGLESSIRSTYGRAYLSLLASTSPSICPLYTITWLELHSGCGLDLPMVELILTLVSGITWLEWHSGRGLESSIRSTYGRAYLSLLASTSLICPLYTITWLGLHSGCGLPMVELILTLVRWHHRTWVTFWAWLIIIY